MNPDPNSGAKYIGPYTDPGLTQVSGPFNPGKSIPGDRPVKSGSTTLGEVKVYDPTSADGTDLADHTPNNSGVKQPPNPDFWPIENDAEGIPRSRDPYAVDGMIGQDYLKNQGAS